MTLSSEFKSRTVKAVLAIALFMLVYLIMLGAAIGLTVLCVLGGLMLITYKPMLATIVVGIGLASLGVLVLFFLMKFMFKSHKMDRSHLTEITREDEPVLFDMIDDIVKQVGTSSPKRVYLSADVTAAVFYDSNFWSMFLPVEKNLQIGLGLVNTVMQSELKAILSHEFGHFSQRTMRVGSYVYNVNQVIFNLLYDNESYERIVNKMARANWIVSLFLVIAVKITEGIKWVLRRFYDVVNKSYLALSREMEFHADEIAAHVTGYEPLKSSLLRLALAEQAFLSVTSFYGKLFDEHIKPANIYRDHLFVTNFLAMESRIPIEHGLPQITVNEMDRFNKSKLVIQDQWASHPSTKDRIAMLEKTGLPSGRLTQEPANLLFADIGKTQVALTRSLFGDDPDAGESTFLTTEAFQSRFKEDFARNTYDKVYNGYYDNKNPISFDLDGIGTGDAVPDIGELFSDDRVEEVYASISLRNDIDLLKHIAANPGDVRTFDYDGRKYPIAACKELIAKLDKEWGVSNARIRNYDIDIFRFFRDLERKVGSGPALETLYGKLFAFDKRYESRFDLYTRLSNKLEFVHQTTPFEKIRANLVDVEILEKKLKKEISGILEDPDFKGEMTDEMVRNFGLYLSRNWQYFGVESYIDQNLEILFTALNNYAYLLSRLHQVMKRNVLDYQVELLKSARMGASGR